MKKIKVVAAIIQHADKILIAKRSKGEFEGMFEFPGGKVEIGETAEQALEREILEELEVRILVNSFFTNVIYEYSNFVLDMDCYLCSLIDTEFVLNDHSEVKWINPEDSGVVWVPADIAVIEKIREMK